MIDSATLAALLPEVIDIAQAAGEVIMPHHRPGAESQYTLKDDQSPVTAADYAANDVITERLKAVSPYPIISEEKPLPPFSEREVWSHYWLVDPLDGTRSFIRGSNDFTVNIALIEHGQSIMGVIVVPATQTVYFATRDIQAQWFEDNGKTTLCQTQSWDNERAIQVATSRRSEQRVINQFEDKGVPCRIQRMGSSVKFCLIARGLVDLYPRFAPTCEWDTAAGQCIVEQAGGQVLNQFGQALRYNTQDSLINPYFLAIGDARLYELYSQS